MFKMKGSQAGGSIPAKLPEGKFRLRIEKCGSKISENKKFKTAGHPLAIVEFTVLEIMRQDAIDVPKQEKNGEPVGKERFTVKPVVVGQRVGWKLDMTKDASGGNLMSFEASTLGVENPQDAGQVAAVENEALEIARELAKGEDYEKKFDALLEDCGAWAMLYQGYCTGKQPMLDVEVIAEVVLKRTSEEGFAFTPHNWYPVDAEAKEESAA